MTRFEAGIADNVIPDRAIATRQLPLRARPHLRGRARLPRRRSSPSVAEIEVTATRRRARSSSDNPLVEAARRSGGARHRAEAGLDERRRLHRRGHRRDQLRAGPHRATRTAATSSSRSPRSCTPTRRSSVPQAPDRRRWRRDGARAAHRRALGERASSTRSRSRRRSRCSTAARRGSRRSGTASWVVNEWAKKAILLYFRLRKVEPMEVGGLHFLDKIPVKADYAERGVRVVPPGVARYGSFLSEGVVLMPGFVNIGAWVGPRTMVDTWATVGSCAQIGADVHLAGGVGIGGVLEPPQARPVIVEDGAFIGSRAVVVEGVVVGEGAVIAPQRRPLRLDPGDRRHGLRAGRAPRIRAAALGGAARVAAEGVPRRHATSSPARSSSASGARRRTSRRRSTTSCGSSRSGHERDRRDRAVQ